MSKIIALCTDADVFLENRIFDAAWAANFPGTEAMPVLADMLHQAGHTIVTGDVALSHVRANYWNAQDITIIQEMDAATGLELIKLGARPKVLIGLESPIFAYPFYDRLPDLAPQFEHRILFRGAFELFSSTHGQNHTAHFPIFYKNQNFLSVPWNERKFMVMVAGNKHFAKNSRLPLSLNPHRYKKWLRKRREQKTSPTLKVALKSELQSKRLEAVEYFGKRKKLDIFGAGWQNLSKLPSKWQKRLNNILLDLAPTPCANKIKTIASYKFAICFENVAYPGYVTEKIIDCILAGVIPVYLGAPDITDFVPKNAFIDTAAFPSLLALEKHLENLPQSGAMEIIKTGHHFLRTPQGQKHSFEDFAQFLFDLILSKE